MSGTIVVGVDGSATARKAAFTARDLAIALGSILHVVSAFDGDRVQLVGSGNNRQVVSDADSAENVAKTVAATLAGGDYHHILRCPGQARRCSHCGSD